MGTIETIEQRLAIRTQAEAGREQGELLLMGMAAMSPVRQAVEELLVGAELVKSDGVQPQHAALQGQWHVVGETPLCFVRQMIDEGSR